MREGNGKADDDAAGKQASLDPERSIPADSLAALTMAVAHAPAGIALFDREMRYLAVSNRFAEDYGRADEPFVGHSHYEKFPDIPARWRDMHRRVIERGEELEHDGEPYHEGSDEHLIRWRMKPWRTAAGAIGGAVLYCEVINREVEERNRLRSAERRFRSIFNLAGVGIARVAPNGDFLEVNNRFAEISGHSAAALMQGGFQRITHPDDLDMDLAHVEDLLAGRAGSYALDKRYIRQDGTTVWVNLTVAMVRDVDGNPDYFISVIEDISERKLADERERLLTRELDHRAKNLLMVVQSIVHLSLAADVEAFKLGLVGRIQALARVHSLLAAARWEAIALLLLVDQEFDPYRVERDRITTDGPNLYMKPAAAQSIALIFHELATNAAKYGALSVAGGRVSVNWVQADQQLILDWQENDGPIVTPPRNFGFGSALIRTSVERQLKGRFECDWLPGGLRCRIVIPEQHALAA